MELISLNCDSTKILSDIQILLDNSVSASLPEIGPWNELSGTQCHLMRRLLET